MKQIPNLITSIRLIASILVLCSCRSAHSWQYFICLFAAAGISDMLDGAIARRFNWCTTFGAQLDSISDLSLYVATSISIFANHPGAILQNMSLILAGAAIQAFHICFCFAKFKSFPAYHSSLARLSAYIIFFLVVLFWRSGDARLITTTILPWITCSLEGILITHKLKKRTENVSSIWAIKDCQPTGNARVQPASTAPITY